MKSILIAMALVSAGCASTGTYSATPIPVPTELSPVEVEMAIVSGVIDLLPPPQFPAEHLGADMAPESLIEEWMKAKARDPQQNPKKRWHVVTREPGLVTAATSRHKAKYYLRVGIRYDAESVQVSILSSRNLNRSGKSIQSVALKWLRRLDRRISDAIDEARYIAMARRE